MDKFHLRHGLVTALHRPGFKSGFANDRSCRSLLRDRNLLLADVVSWVSKPCRCLFHITPVIPNRHFIPSSLLFFIHNSQLALIGGCFQAQLPPNGHRTPRLGSNNGSGDIRDGMVAKRNLAALGPLLLSGRCSGWW